MAAAVILEPKKIVCYCFPIYLPWSDGTGCHDLSFWMLSFQLAFSLSSFTFIKRLFSSSSLYAIRVVSSAYLWLIFLLEILIQACDSSSPGFWWCIFIYVNWKVKIYSLIVLRSNFDPVHCSMFGSNCCFLTHIQVPQETAKIVWYSHHSKNFLEFVVIHTKASLVAKLVKNLPAM